MKGTSADRIADMNCLFPAWEHNTLWSQLIKQTQKFGKQIFIVDELQTCTYSEVYTRAFKTAKAFWNLGVRPGDHMILLLNNSVEYLVLSFALWAVGAVRIPTNPELGRSELTYIINHSDASWIISEIIIDNEVLASCPQVKKVIVSKRNALYRSDSTIYLPELLQEANNITDELFEQISSNCQTFHQLSDIMYTSGSTARPKGVMMTHDKVLQSAYSNCLTRRMEIGRRIYIPLPLFHVFGYIEGFVPAMLVGGTAIISRMKFSVSNALHLIKEHKANDIVCIANIMERLLTDGKPKPEHFPELHAAYFSPSHPQWLWNACRTGFGITDIVTGYGMTETHGSITLTNPSDSYGYSENCHGRIKDRGVISYPENSIHTVQISIRDQQNGTPVKNGEMGEIWCRGAAVSSGYYHDDPATNAAFTKDGWLKTKDFGTFQNDSLHYIGRISDIYKINGEKVSPQFVMNIIEQCHFVEAVEIVGVKHPKYGQVGAAFIDATEDSPSVQNAIRHFCENNLAKFQVPRYYIFMPLSQWPRTASQKIDRKKMQTIVEEMIFNDTRSAPN